MKHLIRLSGIAVLAAAGLVAACRSPDTPGAAAPAKGAAQLWTENCSRCHNNLSPTTHSDAEWDVVVHHMRVRANLTAEESSRVLEFLKAGN